MPNAFSLVSLGLFFVLVFPESTGESCRPHMQGCPSGQGEEEEEGNLESEPIHQAPSQSAERQFPQHLQSGQETVVGRLKGERKDQEKKKWEEEVREMKVSGVKRTRAKEWKGGNKGTLCARVWE